MITLNRIREIAFGLALVAGLVAAAVHPHEGDPRLPASRPALEMCAATKGALCDDELRLAALGSLASLDSPADLGSLTVTARRDTPIVADLGQIIVTARRDTDRVALATDAVANLGSLTVTAARAPAMIAIVVAGYEGSAEF